MAQKECFIDEINNLIKIQLSLYTACKANYDLNFKAIALKPKQCECIRHCIEGCDVIACLPTGYGKSMLFEVLPFIDEVCHGKRNTAILIIMPLNCIISDQIRRLGKYSIKVESVCDLGENSYFLNDRYKYYFGHPEHILHDSLHNTMLQLSSRISWLVIDEAHCIVQWGPTFRPLYSNLDRLRAIFPNANVLALTGTASPKTVDDITKKLIMRMPKCVSASCDRGNIYLSVSKRPSSSGGSHTAEDSFISVLKPLLDEIRNKGKLFPKTIVYMKLKWCGFAYDYFNRELECVGEKSNANISLVAQYHASCKDEVRTKVCTGFKSGAIVLIFATEALGMGIDIQNVRRIVHIGPPYSIETLMQEIGRAGRDGLTSTAQLMYNASDIAANIADMSEDMRKYCLTTDCRRLVLSNYFGYVIEQKEIIHECCDNCAKHCKCSYCKNLLFSPDNLNTVDTELLVVSITKKEQIKLAIDCLFQRVNSSINSRLRPEIFTGLTDNCAISIVENALKYTNILLLKQDYPFMPENVVTELHALLESFIFGD